ncbi:MAG: hypothetical protein KQH83_07160 [Actinobacteria bacterium]|nr:hypothetical protein [Actinomycetota bacterium]
MTTLRSGIGRDLSFRVPSNRFVLIAAPVAGVAWGIWKLATGHPFDHAVVRVFVAGGAAFLAWALGRELDPDRPWTAGLAAVLAAAILGAGIPSLWVAFAVLMAARVASRSTGVAPGPVDLAVLVGVSAGAGATDTGLGAGIVLGVVLLTDRWLPGGSHRLAPLAGVAAIAAAIAASAVWGSLTPAAGLPQGPEWVVVPVAVLGLGVVLRRATVRSAGDLTGEPLSAVRVRAGRVAAVAAGALCAAWAGGAGLTAGSVAWAALAASALPARASIGPGRD